jgi:hypothetical protein
MTNFFEFTCHTREAVDVLVGWGSEISMQDERLQPGDYVIYRFGLCSSVKERSLGDQHSEIFHYTETVQVSSNKLPQLQSENSQMETSAQNM